MKRKTLVIGALLVMLFNANVSAQDRKRVYEVPEKHVSLLLVRDPNCPIQLSDPRFLKYEKGTFEKVYSVTNASGKAVIRFQIKELSWLGGQENTINSTLVEGQTFLPDETFSTLSNEDQLEFLAFDEKVLQDPYFRQRAKDIWIVIVTKVEMVDGGVYDVSSKYEEIKKFIEELGGELYGSSPNVPATECELKEFISKKFCCF